MISKRPAIFFDRDGVINVDHGYVYKVQDFEWINGAQQALALAASEGYLIIIVTNQSGIARGFYTVEDMNRLHDWVKSESAKFGVNIDAIYFCPYNNDGVISEYIHPNHPDRKPNPGMIFNAARDYDIDLQGSLLIGDKPSDIEAAERAGVDARLFSGGDLHAVLLSWLSGRSSKLSAQ
jgi:D-glycero-D-manno-heptose 1,7-bisphosphate phosphatase